MPINFYLHTPLPDDLNERRAIIQVARQLHKQVATSEQTFSLIANINPDHDPHLGKQPQLDALLLGPKIAAILEFKAYFDPIIGHHLTGKWFAINRKNRQQVHGGSQRNPFLQVKNARKMWQAMLNIPLHAFLLFHPYLHPDSKLPQLGSEHSWLVIQSIDEIKSLLFSTRTENVNLDAAKQAQIADTILHCQTWPIEPLLTKFAGYLHVVEPNHSLVRYPVYPYDSFTIGRSKRVNHLVQLNSQRVSSSHAHLFMDGNDLIVEDLDSKNGLFYNNEQLTAPFKLPPNEKLFLGGADGDAPQIWYAPLQAQVPPMPTLPTS